MRGTLRDVGNRSHLGAKRGIVPKDAVDDTTLAQSVTMHGRHSESRNKGERLQNYGFTTVPLPPSGGDQGGQGGQGGGGSGGGGGQSQQDMKAAEYVSLALGGHQSHSVIVAVEDARFRLRGLKPGENAQFDDQQQKMHIQRDQILYETHKQHVIQVVKDEGQAKENAERDQSKAKRTPLTVIEVTKEHVKITRGNATFLVQDGLCIGNVGQNSFRTDKGHTHIQAGGSTIWVEPGGCCSTQPIVVVPHPHDGI